MSDHTLPLIVTQKRHGRAISREIRTEIIRKSIHMLIAFTPLLAQTIGRNITVMLLLGGILLYSFAEMLRLRGKTVFLISRLTRLSERRRDRGHFVLAPVTLGFGAVLALALYPEPAASIAIYALAFGDGLSSLFGKIFGTIRIPFTGGKSVEGSFTCFIAVFVSSFIVLQDLRFAVLIALFSTLLEALPTKDFDNLVLPAGTGFFTALLLIG
jgi:phytol kinase